MEISDKKVLEQFVYDNHELEQIETLLRNFNIFSALKIENIEVRHSNFLSWLFDPKKTHGNNEFFLKQFLKELAVKYSSLELECPTIFEVDNWDYDDFEVLREWKNIDIFIKSDRNKIAIVIENKIKSSEHSNQLQRYYNIIQNEFSNYKIVYIYLTIDGSHPSDENYVPFSYSEIYSLISQLLQSRIYNIDVNVTTFITHYLEMLKRYHMQESDLKQICRDIYKKHKKALDLIFEYKPDLQLNNQEILLNYLENWDDVIIDDCSKSYIRFIPRKMDIVEKEGEGWTKSKRIVLFQINNFPEGINLFLYIGPGSNSVRDRVYEMTHNNAKLFNTSHRNLSKTWFAAYKKSIIDFRKRDNLDFIEIKKIISDKLDKFRENDLIEICKEFENYNQE